jgi:hypothetical protein
MRRTVTFILTLSATCASIFCTADAFASCAFTNAPRSGAATVQETWKAKHIHDGVLGGCIARVKFHNGDEVTGYTHYNYVCELNDTTPVELSEGYACCDAGEEGDFVCGVKPVNPLNTLSQLSTSLFPIKPDVRAIPQIMEDLKKGGMHASRVGDTFISYTQDTHTRPAIIALIPELTALLKEANADTDRSAAIAKVLIQLSDEKDLAINQVDLVLFVLGGNPYLINDDALPLVDVLAKHPEKGETIVPVLVELLHRKSFEEKFNTKILHALPKFGNALIPHIARIYSILESAAREQPTYRDAMNKTFETAKRQEEVYAHEHPNMPMPVMPIPASPDGTQAEPKLVLPNAWKTIVCAAYATPDNPKPQRILWSDNYSGAAPISCP